MPTSDDLYADPPALAQASEYQDWAYYEFFHCFVPNSPGQDPDDHEHDWEQSCDWGWKCDHPGCAWRVDDVGCPEHAPTQFRGLRLVDCTADPPHMLWGYDREDYGLPCFRCEYSRGATELNDLRERRRHAGHRRWLHGRAGRLIYSIAEKLRLSNGRTIHSGPYCDRCVTVYWRWSR